MKDQEASPSSPITLAPEQPEDSRAGWLVLRIRPGEGIQLGNGVELRLAMINNRQNGDAKVAIRASRDITIRRVK